MLFRIAYTVSRGGSGYIFYETNQSIKRQCANNQIEYSKEHDKYMVWESNLSRPDWSGPF